jgi:photosystem II stability/assembly factor-like uncharacterized protein
VDEKTGAVDLALDRRNPRVLYAAMWEHQRRPWKITSGGAASGLYKSADGGDSWRKLSRGLPEGPLGKIGVAVSEANPSRLWAIVEAERGGLYRSEDAGESWKQVSGERVLFARAWYFMRVYADPRDPETVYVLNVDLKRSTDGGKSFETVPTPHADHHDLWISPANSAWMINGNDGGANVSLNGGTTWSRQDNQPTGQFYRVATDDRFPYRVYGCQQDSGCVSIASRTSGSGIGAADWHSVGGGESGFVAFDRDDPTLIYAGANMNQITEYDARSEQVRNIMAYPIQGLGLDARDLRYRFNWNAPISVSTHDPKVIYHAAQTVLKSQDRGWHWVSISPDLTRNQDEKHGSGGGPIMGEAAGGEYYNTISSLVESPHQAGTLWAGSDDGLVHLTREGGNHWENVTPSGMNEAKVNAIEVSPHDPAGAYLAVTRYLLGDPKPYIFKTGDYGKSWTTIVTGIDDGEPVRVVREDPGRRGLLYAGTERGVYVSFDDGAEWQSLRLNLPAVPVTDLAIRREDLVASTEGRGFWILDDLTPLQQMNETVAGRSAHLFAPRKAYRTAGNAPAATGVGRNAPAGAILHYYLARIPADGVRLQITDDSGERIRTFTSLPLRAGMNRLVWDLRHEDAVRVPGTFMAADFFGTVPGHRVPPGTYRVELMLGDVRLSETVEVAPDPRVEVTADDFRKQEELLAAIGRSIDHIHRSIAAMQRVRDQVILAVERAAGLPGADEVEEAGGRLEERISRWEEKLIQTRLETIMDAVNFPTRLNEQFLFLKGAVASADARPTASQRERYQELEAAWAARRQEMKLLLDEVMAFNDLLRRKDVPAVVPPGGMHGDGA